MDQRPLCSRPQCAQDWEDRKTVIMELYESKTLKETMKIMEDEHSFKATVKQYKKQLQKWDIDHKRLKPTEYKAMIRKKRQREEDGQKESRFQLRGVEINEAKIVRFQKRHRIGESEQVFNCPTPPDLICTTPATIPTSPDLRPFPWYDIYEKYLDSSMAGPSTIQSNDVQSILHSLIIPFDSYEAQCRFEKLEVNVTDLQPYYSLELRNRLLFLALLEWNIFFSISKDAYHFHVRKPYHLQKLLESLVSKCLDRLKNHSHSLSSLDRVGQLLVLWAVILAGNIYRLKGRRGEAINLLEIVIQLVEQHLDMTDSIIRLFYTAMLIELAECCAEDGHCDEARYLIINKLKPPLDFDATITTRSSRYFGLKVMRYLERGLQRSRRDALELAEGWENGRSDARLTQEQHTQLQEGSSQPETSDWGPFLTDRIEWDEI